MPKSIEVKVSVTDTEVFQEVLEITLDAYNRLSDEDKSEVFQKIDKLLGKDFYLGNWK